MAPSVSSKRRVRFAVDERGDLHALRAWTSFSTTFRCQCRRWAVVGGCVGGLNPVVVRVAADRVADGECRVVVRACAKEGLMKQRAAQKTAALTRDELVGRADDRRGGGDL